MATRPAKNNDDSSNTESTTETPRSNKVSFIDVAAPVVSGNRGPQRPAVQKEYDTQALDAYTSYVASDDNSGWVRVAFKTEDEKKKIKNRFNSSYRWLRETKGYEVSRQNGSGTLGDGTRFIACRFIPKVEEDF